MKTLTVGKVTGALADIDSAVDYLRDVGGYPDGWIDVAELVRRELLTDCGAPTAKAMGL